MMKFVLVFLLSFPVLAQAGMMVRLVTTKGTILVNLDTEGHPRTVDNFVKLATGETRHIEKDGKKSNSPFYNGLTFHRVNPELGIFSGCPFGDGRGWPGFFISDENIESSTFTTPGVVAMAKIKGEKRSGSQFFITTKALPHLNGKYVVFGRVQEGMDVVMAIANAPRGNRDNPLSPIILKTVEIAR